MACIGPLLPPSSSSSLSSSSSSSPFRLPRSSRAMAKMQPDAFLPTGPVDTDAASTKPTARSSLLTNNNASASTSTLTSTNSPSPLSSSRIITQNGYFDSKPAVSASAATKTTRSPLSDQAPPQSLSQPQRQQYPPSQAQQHPVLQGYLPSNANDIGDARQPRSSSLLPTVPAPRNLDGSISSTIASPPTYQAVPVPIGNGSLPDMTFSLIHPRPANPDDDNAAASAAPAAQMIRRLSQQNSRIREAWEAERKYLEANRERAEEVYKEERAVMDEERTQWEAEQTALLDEIRRLKQHVRQLESDNLRLQGTVKCLEVERAGKVAQASVPLPLPGARVRGGSGGDRSTDLGYAGPSHHASLNPVSDRRINGVIPVELYAAAAAASATQNFSPSTTTTSISVANVPRYVSPPSLSNRISPLNAPMQPLTSPPVDFLASPKDENVPVVDIQTIHPELEGIPLRAPAIQKETFTDSSTNSKTSSRNTSPPDAEPKLVEKKPSSTKDQTLQVLAAPVTRRLVMHAGHTPNHSLSHFPTGPTTEAVTTAGESGVSTPRYGLDDEDTTIEIKPKRAEPPRGLGMKRFEDTLSFELEASAEDHPEALFETDDDPALKGPLMVRNIPAQDEIFFRRLSEKLEGVSRGRDSVPICLQDDEAVAGLSTEKENMPTEPVGADGARDGDTLATMDGNHSSGDSESPLAENEKVEIPLKLKKTTNFGAPLGAMH